MRDVLLVLLTHLRILHLSLTQITVTELSAQRNPRAADLQSPPDECPLSPPAPPSATLSCVLDRARAGRPSLGVAAGRSEEEGSFLVLTVKH